MNGSQLLELFWAKKNNKKKKHNKTKQPRVINWKDVVCDRLEPPPATTGWEGGYTYKVGENMHTKTQSNGCRTQELLAVRQPLLHCATWKQNVNFYQQTKSFVRNYFQLWSNPD